MIKKLAKVIRVLTIPPIMVLGLLLLLYFGRTDVFANLPQLIWAIIFLMVMPILAYPISYFVPKLKKKGRDGQRNLAIVMSLAGYSLGLIYAIIFHVSTNLFLVYLTYFLSVAILTILNKIVKVRASGHACSIAGPLTLAIYFLGTKSIVWCIILFGLIIWSSLELKRHTVSELVYGSLTAIAAILIGLLII